MSTVFPIPLRTPQASSSHPFFTGANGQTGRSKNIWIDERGRINRRPRIWSVGDVPQALRASSLFTYEYRSPSSRSDRVLVMFQERDAGRSTHATGKSSVSLFDGKPVNEFGPGALVNQGTRWRAYNASVIHAGTRFFFDEALDLYTSASAGSSVSGIIWAASGTGGVRAVVDNVDFAVPDGSLVFRLVNLGTDQLGAGFINYRIEGQESGANVHFDNVVQEGRMRTIWAAADSDSFPISTAMTFAQFGRALFFSDDSYRFPVRVWGGGIADAEILPQAPVCSIVTVHQGRLWALGLETNASAFVGSRVGNPFDWSLVERGLDSAISIEIESDDRDALTGAKSTPQGEFLIFKSRSTHRIVGQIRNPPPGSGREYQAIEVSSSIGCASHRTIQQFGSDVLWASDRGVHSLITTDKHGDVESHFLSDPISDLWRNISPDRLRMMQAVVQERLGLYILGMPAPQSRFLKKLVTFSRNSGLWHVWDIGEFTSIGLGPGRAGESDAVYVSRVVDWPNTVSAGTVDDVNMLAVLDFSDQIDFDMSIGQNASAAIDCILEPGDIFGAAIEAAARYANKNPVAIQFYLTPSGDFEADLVYSMDGGAEITEKLGLNPTKKATYGGGFRLGAPGGNTLSSSEETRVATIPITGTGKTLRMRIVDSNKCRLPYLHSDLEVKGGRSQWLMDRAEV